MAANVAAPAPPQQFLTVFVIVRKDLIKTLNWPLGAVIGNACHATAAVLHKFRADERVQAYLSDLEGMRKPVTRLAREVVLETKNEASLDKVEGMLAEHGVKYHKWIEQPEGIAAAIATAPCYRDEVGVTDIILAVNYQPDVMVEAMTKVEEEYGVKVHFSIEPEPLGTGLALLSPESRALTRATNMHQRPPTRRAAGPLALARDILLKNNDVFFVLNADVICEFPFAALLAFHNSHGGEGTLMTTRVEDPSKFGVVLSKPGSTQIQRFVEKPVEFVGDQINAGIYVFTVDILKRIENRPMSIEKDVFPNMARDGQLHSIPLQGFWADVGQPKDFLKGTGLYLASLQANPQASLQLAPRAAGIVGNVLIHETAVIGADCKIGPDVTIGPGVKVGKGVRLSKCVLMKSAVVKDNAWVNNTIVGCVLTTAPPHGAANTQARLDNTTVLGEDVHVADEVYVNGGSVLPHKVRRLFAFAGF
ncbi:mannose-1-phosphate guanyltransferase [Entophlyctis sp. JEL0112]|nr:mannose-1-phosphate guanyltransferase [Entophlyctis sp. JEL0112]